MPRARRIFLSIANELSPVILISGGPPGIVTYWIIAIATFDRRNVLSGGRADSFLRWDGGTELMVNRCVF